MNVAYIARPGGTKYNPSPDLHLRLAETLNGIVTKLK